MRRGDLARKIPTGMRNFNPSRGAGAVTLPFNEFILF